MSGPKHRRNYLGHILSFLFFLFLMEVTLRVYLVQFAAESRFKRYASSKMLDKRYVKPRLTPHEALIYITSPNYTYGSNQHNDLGFRGMPTNVSKKEDDIRIVCIGGSTTYSDGVEDYKESYPYQLEKILQKTLPNVEVINAGVPGHSSYQNLQNYLLRVQALSPDYVLLYQGINDLMTRLVWPPESFKADLSGMSKKAESTTPSFWQRLSIIRVPAVMLGLTQPYASMESMVQVPDTYLGTEYYNQLRQNIYPSGIFGKVPVDSILKVNGPEFMEQNTRQLSSHIKANHSKLVLVTFAYSPDFENIEPRLAQPEFQAGIQEHNQLMRSLANQLDLDMIDLAHTIGADATLFTDGIHFNAMGNRLRAEAIAESLIPILTSDEK